MIFLTTGFFHESSSSGPLSIQFGPFRNELRISPRIFVNIRNGPNGVLRNPGETDSWRKPELENLVTDSLNISELYSL
jgi:hypothetical protein